MQDQAKLAKLGIGFLIIILAAGVMWKLDLFAPDISKSPLVIAPQEFNFGEISMAKGNAVTKMMLQNDGDDKLKITDVRTSCMCTTATIDGTIFGMHKNPAVQFVIPPKGAKEMTVTFDPNAHGPEATGPIDRVIFIQTNSEATPNVQARVSGNVVK